MTERYPDSYIHFTCDCRKDFEPMEKENAE